MFIDDLRKAIKNNEALPRLLDSCIRPPKQTNNIILELVKWRCGGEEKFNEWILDTVKDHLFNTIKNNQAPLQLLNSPKGRKYLHNQLDALLDYLTGARFATQYKCPKCSAIFPGKRPNCPNCGVALSWKR